jgi:serpin B
MLISEGSSNDVCSRIGALSGTSASARSADVTPVTADEKAEMRAALQRFALATYAALSLRYQTESFCFSPASIVPILGMLMQGMSRPEDRQQVLDHLQLNCTPERFPVLLRSLTEEASCDQDELLGMASANAVIHDAGWEISPELTESLKNFFNAELFELGDEALSETVNRWVDEKTLGLLPEFLSPEDSRGVDLMLLNALVFEGQWQAPFMRYLSKPSSFYCLDGTKAPCVMMKKAECLDYYGTQDVHCVRLPYKSASGRDCALVLFVPKSEEGFEVVEAELGQGLLQRSLNRMSPQECALLVPRLSLEHSEKDLKGILGDMGLPMDAVLGSISQGAQLRKMLQKVTLSVDEEGTSAAAATSGAISRSANNAYIRADRPFAYALILDEQLQFMGAVKDASALVTEEMSVEMEQRRQQRLKEKAEAFLSRSPEIQRMLEKLPFEVDLSQGVRTVSTVDQHVRDGRGVPFRLINFSEDTLCEDRGGSLKLRGKYIPLPWRGHKEADLLLFPVKEDKEWILAIKEKAARSMTVYRVHHSGSWWDDCTVSEKQQVELHDTEASSSLQAGDGVRV